jgi:hypothetical protein
VILDYFTWAICRFFIYLSAVTIINHFRHWLGAGNSTLAESTPRGNGIGLLALKYVRGRYVDMVFPSLLLSANIGGSRAKDHFLECLTVAVEMIHGLHLQLKNPSSETLIQIIWAHTANGETWD